MQKEVIGEINLIDITVEERKMNEYINLTAENIDKEHICCAIGDKKHQAGVESKKEWIKTKLNDGHVFRKLELNMSQSKRLGFQLQAKAMNIFIACGLQVALRARALPASF